MHKKQELYFLRITAQYVAELQAGQQPRLSEYLARYPRYANAIADFVAYYHAVEEEMPPMTSISDSADTVNQLYTSREIHYSPLRNDGVFNELAQESAQQDEQTGELVSTSVITTLLRTATGQRLFPSQLAAELDLSIEVILLLEQRAFAPMTIPHALYEQIGILLQQPRAMVQDYLDDLDHQHRPRSLIQEGKQPLKVAEEGVSYSAPHVMKKQSFRTVVETNLQLSAEQKSHWCAVLDAEGL